MANEMPLHICRHLRTLLYQLLHVVFTKVSWADLLSDFWRSKRWCLKHRVNETKIIYWYETQVAKLAHPIDDVLGCWTRLNGDWMMTNNGFPCLWLFHCKQCPSARRTLNRSLLQWAGVPKNPSPSPFSIGFWVQLHPHPSSHPFTLKHYKPQMAIYGWIYSHLKYLSPTNFTSPKTNDAIAIEAMGRCPAS